MGRCVVDYVCNRILDSYENVWFIIVYGIDEFYSVILSLSS